MFTLILLTLFSLTKAQTNERIFKNALQSLSADTSDQNYLNLLARLHELRLNATCQFITADSKCYTLTEQTTASPVKTTLPQISKIQRQQLSTTIRPLLLAKNFIFDVLKNAAPKLKLAKKVFATAQTSNETATFQFLMGASLSNSILLDKINNAVHLGQQISKGSSLLTLIMFICTFVGTVIYLFKRFQIYKLEKKQRKNQALEAYYMRRRDLDDRTTTRRLQIEEN